MTAHDLHDFTSSLGGKLLIEALYKLEEGSLPPIKQIGEATYAHKLTALEEKIDWGSSASAIHCKIRGLSPRPGAYFLYRGFKIKIITADFEAGQSAMQYPAGTVLDEELTIQCGEGILKPQLVQREGKKMIYAKAFLRGMSIPPLTKLD